MVARLGSDDARREGGDRGDADNNENGGAMTGLWLDGTNEKGTVDRIVHGVGLRGVGGCSSDVDACEVQLQLLGRTSGTGMHRRRSWRWGITSIEQCDQSALMARRTEFDNGAGGLSDGTRGSRVQRVAVTVGAWTWPVDLVVPLPLLYLSFLCFKDSPRQSTVAMVEPGGEEGRSGGLQCGEWVAAPVCKRPRSPVSLGGEQRLEKWVSAFPSQNGSGGV